MKRTATLEIRTQSERAHFGDLYPMASAIDTCRHQFRTIKGKGRWICTREMRHEGPCAAHDSSGSVLAIDAAD